MSPRALPLAAAAALGLGGLAALPACETVGGDTGLSPVTGVLVKSETLFADRGCGTRAAEGFKYAAFVESQDDAVVAAGVYDCFADASFVNLPQSRTGSLTFDVYVLVYDAPTWVGEAGPVGAAVSRSDLAALLATRPTSSTRCRATQQQDVQVLAECDPLTDGARPDAEVELPTGVFASYGLPADGGVAPTETRPVGCGTYRGVAIRPAPGSEPLAPADVLCPTAWAARATPGTAYTIDVTLSNPAGAVLGASRCRALATAGRRSTFACDPFPPLGVSVAL